MMDDSSKVVHRFSGSGSPSGGEKTHDYDPESVHIRGLETSSETALDRGLKARHITMIAIGGAIGTGLIIGTGSAFAKAGPASILISYTAVGFVVFLVMAALGEMAAWLPMSAGFTGYASRFCDPSLGFTLGYTYWFKYIIVTPNQLTAASLVVQYWVPREQVNPGVFIAIFLVAICCINYFGIKFFGEFEFWLSSFKVVVIIGLMFMLLCITCGAVSEPIGFKYWRDPGAFAPYNPSGSITEISTEKFVAFWSTLVTATFAYLGTELVGVTVGEAQNPRRNVPRAIKLTFYRIVIFYCVNILLLGMCIPYDADEIVDSQNVDGTNANASPFVAVIRYHDIPYLDHILNACILMFVFSAANSDLYIASRTLYGLSSDGSAPYIFRKTDKKGLPIYALGMSALFGCLAFLNVSSNSSEVFGYFVDLVSILGLLTWVSILVTHIYFCRARKAQGLEDSAMPYVAPLGVWGSIGALAVCVLISLTKSFDVFLIDPEEGFDYATFITSYLGIPIYLILIFGHKIITKSRGIKPHEADFYTGKDIIDNEEAAFLAAKAQYEIEHPPSGAAKFYNKSVAWLF